MISNKTRNLLLFVRRKRCTVQWWKLEYLETKEEYFSFCKDLDSIYHIITIQSVWCWSSCHRITKLQTAIQPIIYFKLIYEHHCWKWMENFPSVPICQTIALASSKHFPLSLDKRKIFLSSYFVLHIYIMYVIYVGVWNISHNSILDCAISSSTYLMKSSLRDRNFYSHIHISKIVLFKW